MAQPVAAEEWQPAAEDKQVAAAPRMPAAHKPPAGAERRAEAEDNAAAGRIAEDKLVGAARKPAEAHTAGAAQPVDRTGAEAAQADIAAGERTDWAARTAEARRDLAEAAVAAGEMGRNSSWRPSVPVRRGSQADQMREIIPYIFAAGQENYSA